MLNVCMTIDIDPSDVVVEKETRLDPGSANLSRSFERTIELDLSAVTGTKTEFECTELFDETATIEFDWDCELTPEEIQYELSEGVPYFRGLVYAREGKR